MWKISLSFMVLTDFCSHTYVIRLTTIGSKRYVMDRPIVRSSYCILCFSVLLENC